MRRALFIALAVIAVGAGVATAVLLLRDTESFDYEFRSSRDPAEVTEAGNWAFVYDDTLPSDHPDRRIYELWLHEKDVDGKSRANFYESVVAGDRFEIEWDERQYPDGRECRCIDRYVVLEALGDLPGEIPVKGFRFRRFAHVESCGCGRPWPRTVTFHWGVTGYGVAGDDGIRVMLLGEPTPGPGRYRIGNGHDLVITIPAGMTLERGALHPGTLGHSLPAGLPPTVLLRDMESGSTLALNLEDGTERKRVVTPATSSGGDGGQSPQPQSDGDTRDVGALFDELVKSIEMVPP